MNHRNLAIVLISVIGIYSFTYGFYQLAFLLSSLIPGFGGTNLTPVATVLYAFVLVAMYGSAGTVLLLFRKRIAVFIVEDSKPFTEDTSFDALQEIGFSILGLYFFIDGLSSSSLLLFDEGRWYYFFRDGGFWKSVFGVALFFGARILLRFCQFLRRYRGNTS